MNTSPPLRGAASRPLISVVMPVHNRADFLADAVRSILDQTYTNFECIIVDDGSTDASREIIKGFATKNRRIRAFYLEHQGVAAAMNHGIAMAEGLWIARMDSDDIAIPDRLAVSIKWATEHELDVCGGQAEIFGPGDHQGYWFPEEHRAISLELLFRCPILYPSTIIRSEILKTSPHTLQCLWDDYELFTRLAPRYRMGNAPHILLRYRRHATQTSKLLKKEFGGDFQKYRFRLFYDMFPNTPMADYLALARVADRQPIGSLAELERAGRWLADFADHPDDRLRQLMRWRWGKACERYRELGGQCEEIFRKYAEQIEFRGDQPDSG